MYSTFLSIAQIVLSFCLVAAILLQSQGAGLGSVWGKGGETYHTRRGVEKVVFVATIVGLVVFVALSIARLVLRQ
jgi:protein translocase SecG subunit